MNKYGGSKNFILDEENEPSLNKYIKITKSLDREKDAFFFRSDTFFQLGEELDKYGKDLKYQYSGEKKFKEQSHGESFISFFKNRIRKNGIYF